MKPAKAGAMISGAEESDCAASGKLSKGSAQI
jgi:hypothetical protein